MLFRSGGDVVSVRQMTTRKGERMAILQFEDMEGQARIVVFPKVYQKCASLLVEDAVLLVKGRKDSGDDDASILASRIESLAGMTAEVESPAVHTVEIALDLGVMAPSLPADLRAVLERHRGTIPVIVQVVGKQPRAFKARITPNRFLFVDPSESLVTELQQLLGSDAVQLRTRPTPTTGY